MHQGSASDGRRQLRELFDRHQDYTSREVLGEKFQQKNSQKHKFGGYSEKRALQRFLSGFSFQTLAKFWIKLFD